MDTNNKCFIVWEKGELEISNTVSDSVRVVAEAWARNFTVRFNEQHWVEEREAQNA